jgi:hypothetical protein
MQKFDREWGTPQKKERRFEEDKGMNSNETYKDKLLSSIEKRAR